MGDGPGNWIRDTARFPHAQQLAEHLAAYHRMLLEANSAINLVSRRDTASHVDRFMRESLFLAEHLGREPIQEPQLLDLGSGGGFPGLVLKLAMPEVETLLVEATQKKARFLAQVCQALDLHGITVMATRAEELVHRGSAAYRPDLRRRFNWVTAKALGPLRSSLDLAAPFLAPGGVHWTFKGGGYEKELAACRHRMRQLGCKTLQILPIPGDQASYLVPIQRTPADVSRETLEDPVQGE